MATFKRTTAKNYTGVVVGRLTAVESTERRSVNNIVWRCLCSCGNTVFVSSNYLRPGRTMLSCGCLKREMHFKHGKMGTREYVAWQAMRQRCSGNNEKNSRNYCERGISVCDRWNYFTAFLTDMGHCPAGSTLDRIDNSKGYSPDNCRWASYHVQNRNNRRTIHVTLNGRTQCLADWASELGLSKNTVNGRIFRGWSHEDALLTPKGRSPKKNESH